MKGPLSHVRVLDLTRVLAGPWATQNLADMGADVIKIERPVVGDDTRSFGPPYLKDRDGKDTGESAYFISANRNKRSVCLDLKSPGGKAAVLDLAARSDVLIENYKVGALRSMGLSYEDVCTVNPSIVYCSITGFGQTGPYALLPGYDVVFQAMGGLMSITGERDGPPQKVGTAVADIVTGIYAGLAIVSALLHRERTGQGQYMELSLLDAVVSLSANQVVSWFCSQSVPRRWGNGHAHIIPYGLFDASDGPMILAIGNDEQFARFCAVSNDPRLRANPEFRSNAGRIRLRDELMPLVIDVMKKRSRSEWLALLGAAGIPCGPLNDLRQVFEDPHVRARGLKVDTPHPCGVEQSTPANPMRFSGTPVSYRRPAPLLGQHTTEVLSEVLGYDRHRIDELLGGQA